MAVQRSLGWALPKKSLAMTGLLYFFEELSFGFILLIFADERYRLLASVPASLYVISSFFLLCLSEYLKK